MIRHSMCIVWRSARLRARDEPRNDETRMTMARSTTGSTFGTRDRKGTRCWKDGSVLE